MVSDFRWWIIQVDFPQFKKLMDGPGFYWLVWNQYQFGQWHRAFFAAPRLDS